MKALPGPMVLYNEPVTILCQGPPEAEAYEIYKVEEPEPRDGRKLLVAGKTNTSSIQEMKPDQTGLYRCSYQSGGHWSPLSDPLHLVMTGAFDKPSLSSMSGTVVASGDNVTLQCFSRIKFDAFILIKEDAPQFTQRQSSTAQDNGQQTTFHMDRVTFTHAGTYRCYGAFSKYPYVWSYRSNPLQLVVREAADNLDPIEPSRPHGPAGWSVSPQNQVRLSLAGLVLLVLVVLVVEACYSHKRSFYGLRSDPYLSIMTNTEDTRRA
ncbi:Leukocyte immunoglobulin-like receptor subfamily A member 5 [Myotis davidii]|nr:Leukocyte immunoglobulin-like receptor subfamily A member 5 [Myotis davidii]